MFNYGKFVQKGFIAIMTLNAALLGLLHNEAQGEDTSRGRKMGGVYLGEGKNGGSVVKRRKKWGEYT